MPHAIVEYSSNLEADLDVLRLIDAVHAAALATGIFPIGGLRTRAARRTAYRIADGHPDNAFVHIVLRVGHGRDEATRKAAAETVFKGAEAVLEPLFGRRPLGLSLEMVEIDAATNLKRNNLHDYVEQRRKAAE